MGSEFTVGRCWSRRTGCRRVPVGSVGYGSWIPVRLLLRYCIHTSLIGTLSAVWCRIVLQIQNDESNANQKQLDLVGVLIR